jgi:hypothetical protein
MKVIGTGGPAVLTLRLREREVEGLKDELMHRGLVAEEAKASLREEADDRPSVIDGARTPSEIIEAVAEMQEHLANAEPNEQGRVVVIGPTWLLGPAIRGAAVEAAEQLVSALRRFAEAKDSSADELRDAVAVASAWSETLIGYEHVQNYGLTS